MQQILFIAIGALIGAFTAELGGLLLGATIGWLVARMLKLQRQMQELREQLAQRVWQPAIPTPDLTATAAEQQDTAPVEVRPLAPVASPQAATVEPEIAAWQARTPTQTQTPTQTPARSQADTEADVTPQVASPAPPPSEPSWFDRAREWLFGGNTVAKAGIGVLFVGLAFLAKYASEHVQLPVELRLAGIAAAALVLLVLGWRLRDKRPAYAQLLQGGAIATLYLTLFAAFRFFGLVGVGPTFALMVAVAALGAALAVLQNSPALAVVGALGGFATPLLVSTGAGNHVALFGYYLVLNLGIAAVGWFRTWRALNLIGFVFSFGVMSLWVGMRYSEEHYLSAQLFLIAFFLVFVLVLLLPARQLGVQPEGATPALQMDRWVNSSLLFGLPVVGFGLQYALVQHTRYGAAISALVGAAFYVALASGLRGRPRLALAFEGCLAVGTILLTLVIPFALDARSTAGAWALEGAGLVWLGWRQHRWLARAFGYGLIVVSGLLLLHSSTVAGSPTTWLGGAMTSGVMLSAGALLAALFVWRHAPRPADQGAATRRDTTDEIGERIAEPLLIAWAVLAAVGTLALHVDSLVVWPGSAAVFLAGLAGLAAVFTLLAERLRWPRVALPVLGFAPAALIAATVSAVTLRHPFLHGGAWAWPLALAVHAFTLQRAAVHWPAWGRQAVHVLGVLLLATLGAAAGRGMVESWGDTGSAWPWLGWLAVPAALLLVLPRPWLAGHWPIRVDPAAYAGSAGLLLSLGSLLWTLLANIVSNGAAQPLPYVPVVNPLDLGIALALFAAWRWSDSDAGRSLLSRGGVPASAPAVVLGGIGFVWMNAMLVRAFHHLGDVPFRFAVWTHSLAVQTGLTLLWAATALPLMWWGSRRGRRGPWMVGAALLAAVVLKLLLVDLSGTGTVTRIVSFIGAGVLMLVIGYIAPIPAAARTEGAPRANA